VLAWTGRLHSPALAKGMLGRRVFGMINGDKPLVVTLSRTPWRSANRDCEAPDGCQDLGT